MSIRVKNFLNDVWNKATHEKGGSSHHTLLTSRNSPTISPSTTVTNFSSIQSFQSINSSRSERVNRYYPNMGTKEQNMVIGAGEIAPLNSDSDTAKDGGVTTVIGTPTSINSDYPTDYQTPKQSISIIKQIIAALTISIGSMTVGFSSAYTSPALESMKSDNVTTGFTITENEESWIGGLLPLAALVGGIIGGPMIEYLGRKKTIFLMVIPFIIAWILMANAYVVEMLYAGRILCGFAVGVVSLAFPVYLGETLQPEVRGMLGLMPTALGNIGILVCFIAGSLLNWIQLAVMGAILPIPFVILMYIIPETPRWYISKGRKDDAETALIWLRGNNYDTSDELNDIEKSQIAADKNSTGGIGELFQFQYLKPLLISLGLMLFQQMSGINAVIFYAKKIFTTTGSSIDSNVSSIIIGVVNFVSTFIASGLIDRLGRKILLYISSVSMTITLIILSIYFYMKDIGYDMTEYGWIPLPCFIVYIIGFSLGFGPIPWLMMGEILPAVVRGPAASIATAFNWSCTFIVTKTFNNLIGLIGEYGTFGLFAKFCFLGLFFTILFVPETQGRTLEDIEKTMTNKRRRLSSVINIKPMPTAC